MSIPFFSIDFRQDEWLGYFKGLLLASPETTEDQLISLVSEDFSDHELVLFPSARMAFYLTLENYFNKGDELIFPVLGFPLYVKIAQQLGLHVRLEDVEQEHLTLDPDKLRESISSDTKGIVVTHLFGHPAKNDEIVAIAKEFDLLVIEDCAQSYDSYYKNQPTGVFGDAGIFSCSLMKVPTTLGGGILVTKDKDLVQQIKEKLQNASYSNGFKDKFPYFIKNSISILNSYPVLYSVLSHHVFGLLKNRNPSLLRKILYSGMGVATDFFDPWERPKLSDYQLQVGLVQFAKRQSMMQKRRNYSKIIDDALEGVSQVKVLKEDKDVVWNYQYHVIGVEKSMETIFHQMFDQGIHLMQENVWDCTGYVKDNRGTNIFVGVSENAGLLRIPNNSLLGIKDIEHIASTLKKLCQSL